VRKIHRRWWFNACGTRADAANNWTRVRTDHGSGQPHMLV